jgi:hypothetical protein
MNQTARKATDPEVLKLALKILNRSRKAWESYLEDCEQDRRNGHRPHYCFHGMSQWTDYDNICGSCEEDGNYWSYETYARIALDLASVAVETQGKRIQMLIDLMRDRAPITITEELSEWVKEPVTRYE